MNSELSNSAALAAFPIPPSAWDNSLALELVFFHFSDAAEVELCEFLSRQDGLDELRRTADIERIAIEDHELRRCREDLVRLEQRLQSGARIAILRFKAAMSLPHSIAAPWLVANLLGELLPQNVDGDRFYIITDQGGRMEEGARYSQTNQGGSYHTDSVNLKQGYDYFLLSCVVPAAHGGESILIDGFSVLRELKAQFPQLLPLLNTDLTWEYKGIYDGRFYLEPIVKLEHGKVVWRYLRDYIEGAALKSGHPLSNETIAAMDALDTVLDDTRLQLRYSLQAGETAIINDRSIFHGRTSFVDHPDAIALEDHLADPRSGLPIKRTYSRMWVNRRP